MKFCPTCQTRYDEEILRFCTKDGTPLVEEDQPNFTALPSETSDEDDFGEETVIRRNPPKSAEPQSPSPTAEPIVIQTASRQEVRPQAAPAHREPPPRSNTATVVLVTILGTLAALGLGAGAFWLFSDRPANEANVNQTNANANFNGGETNANANFNTDLFANTNVNTNVNANFNTNVNVNTNVNTDANLRTPSPTRTPSPSPSPSATPADANTNSNANTSPSNANTEPRPATPTPTQTPRSSPSPTAPANVNVGVMNSRAINLTKPAYPQTARQAGASGQVTVAVSVDEAGNVLSARAVSGHPLLRVPAEAAARQSRFNPVKIGEQTVKANGILVYNFINQ